MSALHYPTSYPTWSWKTTTRWGLVAMHCKIWTSSGPTCKPKAPDFPVAAKYFKSWLLWNLFTGAGLVKTGLLKVNQSMRFQSHAWGNWQTGRVPLGVGCRIYHTGKEENSLDHFVARVKKHSSFKSYIPAKVDGVHGVTFVKRVVGKKTEEEGAGSFLLPLRQLTAAKSWAKHSLVSEHSQRFAIWPNQPPGNSDGGSDVPGHNGPGRGGGHPHQLPLQLPPHVQPAHHGPADDQQPPSRAYKVKIEHHACEDYGDHLSQIFYILDQNQNDFSNSIELDAISSIWLGEVVRNLLV